MFLLVLESGWEREIETPMHVFEQILLSSDHLFWKVEMLDR